MSWGWKSGVERKANVDPDAAGFAFLDGEGGRFAVGEPEALAEVGEARALGGFRRQACAVVEHLETVSIPPVRPGSSGQG